MDIIALLLRLFMAGRYEMTDHALESMDEDLFELADLLPCLRTGRLRRAWPRIKKYEIDGRAVDGRWMRLVSRLVESGDLRIITVYEVH